MRRDLESTNVEAAARLARDGFGADRPTRAELEEDRLVAWPPDFEHADDADDPAERAA